MHLDIKPKTIKYIAKNMRKLFNLAIGKEFLAQMMKKEKRNSLAKLILNKSSF